MFLFTALLLACACWRQAELPGRWRSRGASIVGQEMQPGFCAGASKQTASLRFVETLSTRRRLSGACRRERRRSRRRSFRLRVQKDAAQVWEVARVLVDKVDLLAHTGLVALLEELRGFKGRVRELKLRSLMLERAARVDRGADGAAEARSGG